MSSGSSSQIKGGGKAILSQESQLALIDLLMSLDKEDNSGIVDDSNKKELSAHDKKREQKRYMKRLICQFEQRQLQQKFNATTSSASKSSNDSTRIEQSRSRSTANPTAQSSNQSTSNSNSGNVRIELVEAIFPKSDTKDKKKGSSSDTKKKKKKKDSSTFKVGTKKVLVLPKTTSISDLLKKSKSKLKLKKTPIRAFIQHEDQGILFDLDIDISGLEDGTVLYVSVTPKPLFVEGVGDCEVDNEGDKDQTSSISIIDPLESVKQAYQKQEVYRNTKQYNNSSPRIIPEVINDEKRTSLTAIRQSLPVSNYKEHILQIINENEVVVLSGATGSGKSTQVPQFLLEESNNSGGNNRSMAEAASSRRRYIVVTQPRKVAAISLASRVAEERGCPPPGVNGSSVGYMVRSDRKVCLPSFRIIYMTIGILLRMLVNQRNESNNNNNKVEDDDNIAPQLSIDTISHLIIDETHERDVNTGKSAFVLFYHVNSWFQYDVSMV